MEQKLVRKAGLPKGSFPNEGRSLGHRRTMRYSVLAWESWKSLVAIILPGVRFTASQVTPSSREEFAPPPPLLLACDILPKAGQRQRCNSPGTF